MNQLPKTASKLAEWMEGNPRKIDGLLIPGGLPAFDPLHQWIVASQPGNQA